MSAMTARGSVGPGDAAPRREARQLLPLTIAQLDAVMVIETSAYAFPWTRGNFIDSIAAGYVARVLWGDASQLLGYYIAMAGVDEMHLLNITVAPAFQGRGHARFMLDDLVADCRQRQAKQLWLEVRESNARARAVYLHLGFQHIGQRKGYYPAARGRREDATVMALAIRPAGDEVRDGLD
jgi:[ribosomal protein S18]-alanine N-acetyltransferase